MGFKPVNPVDAMLTAVVALAVVQRNLGIWFAIGGDAIAVNNSSAAVSGTRR